MSDRPALLAVYAHPDDEAVRAGGTLAMLASRGVRVHLVCATRGEAGQMEALLCERADLGRVREEELAGACRALGIEPPVVLGYPDGGLARVQPAPVVDYLVRAMAQWDVSAVLTFGPDGISRHPDHVAIGRMARQAFWRSRQGRAGALARPAYLYHQVVPARVAREFGLGGVPGVPDERVTHTIDVSAWLEVKMGALACHRSQWPAMRFLRWPQAERDRFLGTEHFRCVAAPPGAPRQGPEILV